MPASNLGWFPLLNLLHTHSLGTAWLHTSAATPGQLGPQQLSGLCPAAAFPRPTLHVEGITVHPQMQSLR